MDFENRAFENNARESMKTISDLKKSLDFTGSAQSLKELEEGTRNFRLGGLSGAVDEATRRFSVMEIVGITALANITNSAVNAGKALLKNITVDQITAGWQKFANKTTAIQTIMAATANQFSDQETQMAAVNEQLDKLSWFTDETSYNFVDMVSNIGKFTSNNIELEKSVTAMQGIATWAAISGANTNDASRAMYNLSQAIGTGSVTLLDWRSIENANMATAEFKQTVLDVAVEMNQLRKVGDGLYETMEGTSVSVSNFREGLKDKWFTNDVLTATLDRYGAFATKLNSAFNETGKLTSELLDDIDKFKSDVKVEELIGDATVSVERYKEILSELSDESMEFGMKAFKAAQETKTFAEVIDYTKDAVSSQWMGIFEAIFGGYLEAKALWTQMSEDFYTLFVKPLEDFRGVIEGAFGSQWDSLAEKIKDTGLSLEDFEQHVRSAMDPKALDDLIKEYGSFEAAARNGAIASGTLKSAFDGMVESALANADATGTVTQAYINLEDVVKRVINGEFGNGEARMRALADAGYDYATVQELVNRTLAGEIVNYEVLNEQQLQAAGYTDEQIAKLKELQAASKDADSDLNALFESAGRPSGRQLFAETIQNSFQALIKTIAIIKSAWRDVFPAATSERIYNLISVLHDFTENVLTHLDKNAEKIKNTLRGLFSILDIIVSIIKGAFKMGLKVVGALIGAININIWDITSAIGNWIYKIRNLTVANDKLHDSLKGFVVNVINRFKELGKSIKNLDSIKQLTASFERLLASVRNIATSAWSWIVDKFTAISNVSLKVPISGTTILVKIVDFLAKALNKVIELASKAKTGISEFFSNVKSGNVDVGPVFDNIASTMKSIAKAIGDSAVGSIGDYISNGFSTLFTSIKDKVKNFDFKALFAIVKQAFRLYFLYELGGFTKAVKQGIKKPVSSLQELIGAFKGVLGSLSNTIAEYGKNLKADSVLKLAIAIGVLAASVAVLSFIPHDQLADAASVIVILGIVLTLIMKTFTNFANAKADSSLIDISNAMESIKISIVGFLKSIAATAKIVAMGFAVSAMLISIAVAVTMLIGAVFAISKIVQKDPDSTAAAIIGIMGLILALGGSIKMMGSANTGGLIGGASAILAVAISVTVIVGAVKTMQDAIKGGNFIGALMSVIGIMTMMGVMIRMTDDFGTAANAASFLGFAVAIRIIIGGIASLAELNGGMVVLATAAIAAVLLLLTKLTGASNGANPAKLSAMANSLIVISAAIGIFVFAVTKLGENADAAGTGFLLLAGSILVFVAAAAAVSYLGLGAALIEISIGLVAFGVAALAVGGAFALIGVGVDLITKGFARLGPALKSFVNGWIEAAKSVLQNASLLKDGTAEAMDVVISAIISKRDKLFELGVVLVETLAKAIIVGGKTLALAGVTIIIQFLETLASMILPIAFAIGDIIVAVLNAVAEVIRSYGPAILAALFNIVIALVQMLISVIADVVDAIPLAGGVADIIRGWNDDISSSMRDMVADTKATTDKAKKELADSLDFSNVVDESGFSEALGRLKSPFGDGSEGLGDVLGIDFNLAGENDGKLYGTAWYESVQQGLDEMFAAQPIRVEVPKLTEDQKAQMEPVFAKGNDGQQVEIDPNDIYFGDSGYVLQDVPDWNQLPEKAHVMGQQTTIQLSTGLRSKLVNAIAAVNEIRNKTTSGLDGRAGAFSAGFNTMLGYLNGLESKKTNIFNAAAGITNGVLNTFKSILRTGSPSKATREIGEFTGMGFILGLLDQRKAAIDSTEDFAQASVDTLNSTVAKALSVLESDYDYAPTIRPVLDLTNVTSGMSNLSSMFNNAEAIDLGARVRIGESDEARYNDFSAIMAKRDLEVQREFSSLRGSVDELIAKIDNLELRMDGDDIVAGLSNKFDNSMGRIAAMKQRGM